MPPVPRDTLVVWDGFLEVVPAKDEDAADTQKKQDDASTSDTATTPTTTTPTTTTPTTTTTTTTNKMQGTFDCTWYGTVHLYPRSPDPTQVLAPERQASDLFCRGTPLKFRVHGRAVPVDDRYDANRFKVYHIDWTTTTNASANASANASSSWWACQKNTTNNEESAATIRHDQQHGLQTALQWQGHPDKRTSLCFGTGRTGNTNDNTNDDTTSNNNDTTAFVATGWMRPGNRLTVARRYVTDAERSNLDPAAVRAAVLDSIYCADTDEIVMPPWMCPLFRE